MSYNKYRSRFRRRPTVGSAGMLAHAITNAVVESREHKEAQAARIRAALAEQPRMTPYAEFLRRDLTTLTKELS